MSWEGGVPVSSWGRAWRGRDSGKCLAQKCLHPLRVIGAHSGRDTPGLQPRLPTLGAVGLPLPPCWPLVGLSCHHIRPLAFVSVPGAIPGAPHRARRAALRWVWAGLCRPRLRRSSEVSASCLAQSRLETLSGICPRGQGRLLSRLGLGETMLGFNAQFSVRVKMAPLWFKVSFPLTCTHSQSSSGKPGAAGSTIFTLMLN